MRADVRCKRANLCDANTHTRIHICMHAWSHKLYILHFTFHLTFFTFTLTVLPTHFVHVAHALLPFPLPLRLHCVAHICATLLCLHNLYYTSSCILFQSASCTTTFSLRLLPLLLLMLFTFTSHFSISRIELKTRICTIELFIKSMHAALTSTVSWGIIRVL